MAKMSLIQGPRIHDAMLGLVAVRPEHASEIEGCTHTCKHIAAALDDGKPIAHYSVRFHLSEVKTLDAAVCRECYVRLLCEFDEKVKN